MLKDVDLMDHMSIFLLLAVFINVNAITNRSWLPLCLNPPPAGWDVCIIECGEVFLNLFR